MKFRGNFAHVIDDKGRVSVPARFREILLSQGRPALVLTHSVHNPCIDAFPLVEYEAAEARFEDRMTRERFTAQQRNHFYNLVFGNAQECELDDQGRLLVPPKLRADFSLERDVVFSGAGSRFRLWRDDVWAEEQKRAATLLTADTSLLDVLDF